ncbi:MAG: tRNA (adenosine(37)-N6)-threonylcarbamoyltransferase complex dimerization subunit type 1 TsaB [Anaerolineae bacterium]|nr:tRNA (adenosine(37)-N6)-threonylcarbamoyltransferase complex dimerization subunit type 1 TsaB [Anaerolineae bacterium]
MLLAIDTSTQKIGLALYDGVQVRHEAVWPSPNHHTVELSPAIQSALDGAGLTVDDLQAVCVATGPGSYTGLRIGMAAAKGLALACSLPIVGVPTFDVLVAAQTPQDMALAAVLEAGRGRLAVGWYESKNGAWKQKKDAEVLTPQEFSKRIRQPTLICGELSEDVRRLLGRKRVNVTLASPAESFRRPGYLAELGWQRWQAGEVDDPYTLAPTYLHAGEAIPA